MYRGCVPLFDTSRAEGSRESLADASLLVLAVLCAVCGRRPTWESGRVVVLLLCTAGRFRGAILPLAAPPTPFPFLTLAPLLRALGPGPFSFRVSSVLFIES